MQFYQLLVFQILWIGGKIDLLEMEDAASFNQCYLNYTSTKEEIILLFNLWFPFRSDKIEIFTNALKLNTFAQDY